MAGTIVTFTCTLLAIVALHSDRCMGREIAGGTDRSPLSSVEGNESQLRWDGGSDKYYDFLPPYQQPRYGMFDSKKSPVKENQNPGTTHDSIQRVLAQRDKQDMPTSYSIVLPKSFSRINNVLSEATEEPGLRESTPKMRNTNVQSPIPYALEVKPKAPRVSDSEVRDGPLRKKAKLDPEDSVAQEPKMYNVDVKQTPSEKETLKDLASENPPNPIPMKKVGLAPAAKAPTSAPEVASPEVKPVEDEIVKAEDLPPRSAKPVPAPATAELPVQPQQEVEKKKKKPVVGLDPPPLAPEKQTAIGQDPLPLAPEKQEESKSSPQPTGEGETYHGDITYYAVGGQKGACGIMSSENEYIAAIHQTFFTGANPNEDPICNKKIAIWTPGKNPVIVTIRDKLPEGKRGDIDLPVAVFAELAHVDQGRVPASWKFVN
ncbi:hypothetical protein IWQ62_005919 [Dispira parvispora]|uniref:Uncharacterized protein n=1 Tax=Dispira parvispora TaxID=1520584 RepID=A0A9W8DZ48_9FUNG|nr:hypothetical protein IWQ62_005919 [Dispira parvispora]